MKHCYIYTLSHPINGEIVYVGKTVTSLSHRLSSHIIDSKRHSRKICTWIKKLSNQGLTPVIEELDRCSNDESSQLEQFYIQMFKSWNFILKNHTDGGEGTFGYKHSKEYCELKSKQVRGENNPFYGKKHNDDVKQKISAANKNKKMKDEFCKKRKEYMMLNPLSKETRRKIAEANKIPIVQLDLNLNYITTHKSTVDACDSVPGALDSHICNCCKGKRKSHKGFKWMYKKDYDKSFFLNK
jgi:group I intron endonuclease